MTSSILKKLSSKKDLRIVGINSGTSADGIDLALISFTGSGKKLKIKFIDGRMIPYTRRIKVALENIIRENTVSLDELGRYDIAFGTILGKAAAKFLKDGKHKADLVASHGQTIAHYPAKEKTLGMKCGTTIQIGDGNSIATATGLPVISDFRRADISVGGEGAPLTPFVNHLLFGHKRKSRIIINIGGIANYSYHPAGSPADTVRGGDCGPGNILSDLATRLLFHKKFDRNGAIAARGEIHREIIMPIIETNKGRRVSAGREQFDRHLLARLVHMARKLKAGNSDLLASIDQATAMLIVRSIKRYIKDPNLEAIYLTGGGRKNLYIEGRLQELCAPVPVRRIETLGYDGDFLEAVSFAVLGGCYVNGIASTLPHVTEGKSGGVAGKMSLPPM